MSLSRLFDDFSRSKVTFFATFDAMNDLFGVFGLNSSSLMSLETAMMERCCQDVHILFHCLTAEKNTELEDIVV